MNAADFATLAPTPAAYLAAARAISRGEVDGLRPLRLAVLSTVTAELSAPYFAVEAARAGFALQPWFAGWGQLEEAALDSAGPLFSEKPDAVLILTRLEDLAPTLFADFLAMDDAARLAAAQGVAERLRGIITAVRTGISAPVFVANFAPPQAGLADAMLATSLASIVQHANARLAAVCREFADVFIFDLAATATAHGLGAWVNRKLQFLSRMPFAISAQIALARSFARHLRAAFTPPAKVLVLDLDNTLWGGVLGEDGIGGIALGDEHPGSVFKEFQRYCRSLRQRGVLLAVASKNNEADVDEAFARHGDMVLKKADFSAVRINWEPKSNNIRAMAAELNLGLDAFVFFDDSAFEREEVRRALPQVRVVETPASPLDYVAAIEDGGFFDRLIITAEDRQRAQLYAEQCGRAELERNTGSKEEFLASLGLAATIGHAGPDTLPRIAQLLAKTNQFNLTTRRHTAAELEKMLAAGAVALWLRLADRFGDHGLVGVAIATPGDIEWTVDSFLLSCRVIGRGVETALLATLAAEVFARGATSLVGEFFPTAKNAQVAGFFPEHGFTAAGEARWTAGPGVVSVPPFMEIRRQ